MKAAIEIFLREGGSVMYQLETEAKARILFDLLVSNERVAGLVLYQLPEWQRIDARGAYE